MIRETFRKMVSFFRKTSVAQPTPKQTIFEKKFNTTEQDEWQEPTKSNFISDREKRHRRIVNAMQRASRKENR